MKSLIASTALAAALVAPGAVPAAAPSPPAGSGVAPARHGDVAIQQELEAARRAGTRAAYDLFIARHPTHPLATTARGERARLPAAAR